MTIAWLAPAAFAGLFLIALPIAVHLLVRQQAREQLFPSLRFLRETQLAALRRRRIEDAALLLCRAAIIAAAILALAGPVVMTPARTATQASRVSRAVIVSGEGSPAQASDEAAGAFRSVTINRADIADAISDAMRWFEQQPPSAREIVMVGALQRGAVTAADLAAVPRDIGIRFARSRAAASPDVTVPILTRRNDVLTRIDRPTQLSVDGTRVTDGGAQPVANDLVAIVASGAHAPVAEAALAAALDAGIPWRDFSGRVLIVWDGADEAQVKTRGAGARVIRMPRPVPDSAAADAVRAVLSRVSRPLLVDSVAITDEQLTAWSRPAGPPSPAAPVSDEGDRRWVWALALALLALEWWLRERRSASVAIAEKPSPEVRVA